MNKEYKKKIPEVAQAHEPLLQPQPAKLDQPVTQGEFREAIIKLNARMDTGFAEIRGEMKAGFAEIRGEMKAEIRQVENSMTRLILWTGVVLGGVILSAMFGMLQYLTA